MNYATMKLVSACLVGVNCNFKGKNWLNPKIFEEFKKGEMFPVCPEVLGGLTVPRNPSEIQNGDGRDVLSGDTKIINEKSIDVTDQFIKGAQETLRIAKLVGAKEAVFTEKSPSCGCNTIFDGTFSEKLSWGEGVTAALLKKNGVKVISIKV